MPLRIVANDWYKTLWRIVRNPAIEVIAAIVVVMLAAWVAIETETEHRGAVFPLFSEHK